MSFGFFTTKEKTEIESFHRKVREAGASLQGYENYSFTGYKGYNKVAMFDESIFQLTQKEKAEILFNIEKTIEEGCYKPA